MRCLGIDLGTKTVGLALSDNNGLIASMYKVIRYTDINEAIKEICQIINEKNITKIILGLPKNMDNSLGPAAQRSLKFKELLELETNIEIILIDERLTTVEAENLLISADVSRKKRKDVIDKMAAAIILDAYLRSNKRSENE